jgi:hypothetical protein
MVVDDQHVGAVVGGGCGELVGVDADHVDDVGVGAASIVGDPQRDPVALDNLGLDPGHECLEALREGEVAAGWWMGGGRWAAAGPARTCWPLF